MRPPPDAARRRLLAALPALACGAARAAFVDPLEQPAAPRRRGLGRAPMTAVAAAGDALLAAGPGGLVLRREAGSEAWAQASVPVSSDLTTLRFTSAQQGWAAGHDGVLLHSADGGRHWQRRLDGRDVVRLLAQLAAAPPAGLAPERVADLQAMAKEGPVHPWLDIGFSADGREGWLVGAFGLVLHTADGGEHWTPAPERVDNPRGLHLYGLAQAGGQWWLVGEQGLLLRHDGTAFRALESPYRGTLFGVAATEQLVVAYGMRGNAFVSRDRARSWQPVPGLVPAGVTGGCALADGRIVLVTQAAQRVVVDAGGTRFDVQPARKPAPYAAVAALPGGLLGVAGSFGADLETLR